MHSPAKPSLSAIIPCFNEEQNVSRFGEILIPPLDRLGVSYEVVAVDDGSVDGTAERLEALRRGGAPVRVIRHGRNRGLGAALRTAIQSAAGEWAVTLDADMTFAPEQIAALWEARLRSGADWVAGSPELGSFDGVSWRRRLPSRLLNGLYRWMFSSAVSSYTPIFRLYRLALLRELPLLADGFEINAEAAVLLARRGARAAEVPVALTSRALGASKLRPVAELWRHARLIARLSLCAARP